MSDRRRISRGPRWGQVRPARAEWQIEEIELWRMLCRPHAPRRFAVVRIVRRRLLDKRGRELVVAKCDRA